MYSLPQNPIHEFRHSKGIHNIEKAISEWKWLFFA
jgi:hypothetical protein